MNSPRQIFVVSDVAVLTFEIFRRCRNGGCFARFCEAKEKETFYNELSKNDG